MLAKAPSHRYLTPKETVDEENGRRNFRPPLRRSPPWVAVVDGYRYVYFFVQKRHASRENIGQLCPEHPEMAQNDCIQVGERIFASTTAAKVGTEEALSSHKYT